MTTTMYEWDVETCLAYEDGIEDVLEHHHAEQVADLLEQLHEPRPDPEGQGMLTTRLVLVRDVFDDDGYDLTHRSWADVEAGELPERFDDGHRIPLRFHRELAAALARHTLQHTA